MLFTPWNCAFVFNMFNQHRKILECAADWYSQKHQLMGLGAQRRDTHLWICGPWNGSVELPMFLVIAGHGKPRVENLQTLKDWWNSECLGGSPITQEFLLHSGKSSQNSVIPTHLNSGGQRGVFSRGKGLPCPASSLIYPHINVMCHVWLSCRINIHMVMVKSPRSVRFSWLHPQLVIIFQESSKLFLDLPKTSSVFPQISWGKSPPMGEPKHLPAFSRLPTSGWTLWPQEYSTLISGPSKHVAPSRACCQALAVRYGNGWSHWNNDEQCQAQLTG